ncbi:MAG: TonB-dependent receptor [Bacteroidetes bacterium]|nr:MAG: TonB-dependent receptor [Bacteroidota bacterium]
MNFNFIRAILCTFCLLATQAIWAQSALDTLPEPPKQTLRGVVRDLDTHEPLPGATIRIWRDSLHKFAGTSDESGRYRFEQIPVGRYRMEVRFLGHEELIVDEIVVLGGKETIHDIWLRENPESLEQIIVTAAGRDVRTIPRLSSHKITVEENFRLPATFNDPARLAMAYPGVVGTNDQSNAISVRGNNPLTLQWRLEGAEIVNPNHLSNAGTPADRANATAGGVNILSAQMLNTSALYKGAFPVEYGNALGGIMDMNFRSGNDEHPEFTLKTGLLGLEASAEGPFSDSTRASYLFNYRYSFVGLLTSMGVDFGDEKINFQDFSFHLNFPTEKAGVFSFFGVGGQSENHFDRKDSTEVEFEKDLLNIDFDSKMGAIGLKHVGHLGNLPWHSTLVFSTSENNWTSDFAPFPDQIFEQAESDHTLLRKWSFITSIDHKRPNSHLRYGFSATRDFIDFEAVVGDVTFDITRFFTHKGQNTNWIIRPYAEWRKDLIPSLELAVGGALSYYTFPDFLFFEPTFQLTYKINPTSHFQFRSTINSQYFFPKMFAIEFEKFVLRNPGLKPTRTAHLVLGYQKYLDNQTTFNIEFFHQNIFEIPIDKSDKATFSSIASISDPDWMFLTVQNAGEAINFGLETSFRKLLSESFYYIFSTTLYHSTYQDIANEKHPTQFDGRYLINATIGREFHRIKPLKERVFGLNFRMTYAGGLRYTPFEGRAPDLNDSRPFSRKLKDYFRLDARFYRKWNRPGLTTTLAIDLQNMTNRKNDGWYYHDSVKNDVILKKQLGLIPNLSYKIEF